MVPLRVWTGSKVKLFCGEEQNQKDILFGNNVKGKKKEKSINRNQLVKKRRNAFIEERRRRKKLEKKTK